jgi:transcriptional regulator of acetoin/glycerol metabolism
MHLDPSLSMALGRAEKLLVAGLPLVVRGESGTGKSTFAQLAAGKAFGRGSVLTVIDCAMPSREAVIAALTRSASSFHTGAVIFDRVDQLDADAQLTLLSVLESTLPSPSSQFGQIAVTSADLDGLAKEGKFRTDLLHRIRGASIELPPLRNMPDLGGTVAAILALECVALGKPPLTLEEEARLVLCNYNWPGNTRELRQALRHAAALAEGRTIGLQNLPADIVSLIARRDLTARSKAEVSRIEAALRFNNGNVTLTARHLGVSRATLYRKIQIQKMRASA